jgi:hypothetical protein
MLGDRFSNVNRPTARAMVLIARVLFSVETSSLDV